MSVLERVFPNDPDVEDSLEHSTNLYVAGIVIAALGFLVAVKKGLGPKTAL